MGEKDKIMQQLDRAKSQVNSNTRSQRSNLNVSVGSHDGRTVSAEELKVGCNFILLIFFVLGSVNNDWRQNKTWINVST